MLHLFQFDSILNTLYIVIVPMATIINFLLAFICAIVFKRKHRKNIIFKYLYANTICDMLMVLLSLVLALYHDHAIKSTNFFNKILLLLLIYLGRSAWFTSSFISLLIMIQRFFYILTQRHYFKKYSSRIICIFYLISLILFFSIFRYLFWPTI